MSIILDNSDVDIELTSEHALAEDSFMTLNARIDDSSEESEFSDSSFLDIDLDDEIEDKEIDTTEPIELDEHQENQELEEVSFYMVRVIRKLYYKILSL